MLIKKVLTVYICHNGDGIFVPYNTHTFIPDALKRLQNWVLWRIEERDGTPTKVPYSPVYNGRASSTNPNSWGSYRAAGAILMKYLNRFRGLGFVLSLESGLVFVDIDDCISETGVLDDRATDIINTLGVTFCEVSQSGRGLHLFVIGTIPKSFKNPNNGVEMYSCARYCAITGNAIFAVQPVANQEYRHQNHIAAAYSEYAGAFGPFSLKAGEEINIKARGYNKGGVVLAILAKEVSKNT